MSSLLSTVADATPSARVRALFHVTAFAEPGTLPRLMEPVAKLGYVPHRVHASAEAGDGSEITVDLRVRRVERGQAERMAGALRAMVGVRQVIAVFEADE